MRKKLVITDVTRMQGDKVCIAGIEGNGNCVRPTTFGDVRKRHLFTGDRLIIKPSAKIEFDLAPTQTTPPHIEDEAFKPSSIVARGVCSEEEWERILRGTCFPSVADIFDGHLEGGRRVSPGTETRSLGTISDIRILNADVNPWGKFCLGFVDASGKAYLDLPVNDLSFQAYFRNSISSLGSLRASKAVSQALCLTERIYLRIGLARPIQLGNYPKACWTQVTGIYTFPDYLGGKTFADFLRE